MRHWVHWASMACSASTSRRRGGVVPAALLARGDAAAVSLDVAERLAVEVGQESLLLGLDLHGDRHGWLDTDGSALHGFVSRRVSVHQPPLHVSHTIVPPVCSATVTPTDRT